MDWKRDSHGSQRLTTFPVHAVAIALFATVAAGQAPDPAANGTPSGATQFASGSTLGIFAVEFLPGSGSCGSNNSQSVGWQFDVLNPVTVTAMCWFDEGGNGTEVDHEVAIWDPAGNMIASTNVTVPMGTAAMLDGNWRVVDIPPTLLAPGNGYIVGGQNASHSECLSFNVSQTVHPDINFFDATYGGGVAPLERPTSFSGAINGFYGVSFQLGLNVPGTAFCFGDGSGLICPCGNLGGVEEGCANSTGPGAVLTGTGSPEVLADDLVLAASQLPPGVPSLFFAGDLNLNGGNGALFGDGLRCAGGSIVRLEIASVGAGGEASTSVGISSSLGAVAGSTTYFQLWYRDPAGPCSAQFNVSSAFEVLWN